MQSRVISTLLALAALAAPTAAAEPDDGTYVVLAFEHGILTATWHLDIFTDSSSIQSSSFINPFDSQIGIDLNVPATRNAMRMWDTSNMVVYYSTTCEVVNPGVNPDRFPYVYVVIREECLEPLLDGLPVRMDINGPVTMEARWWR